MTRGSWSWLPLRGGDLTPGECRAGDGVSVLRVLKGGDGGADAPQADAHVLERLGSAAGALNTMARIRRLRMAKNASVAWLMYTRWGCASWRLLCLLAPRPQRPRLAARRRS